MDIFKTDENGELKEYQTLFWVPMLFQTAKQAETLIDEMLEMIQVSDDVYVTVAQMRQSDRCVDDVRRTSTTTTRRRRCSRGDRV